MFMTNHILNGQLSECYNFIHSRIYKNSIPQLFKRPTWLFLTIYRNNQPGFSIMVVKDSFSLGMVTILHRKSSHHHLESQRGRLCL